MVNIFLSNLMIISIINFKELETMRNLMRNMKKMKMMTKIIESKQELKEMINLSNQPLIINSNNSLKKYPDC